MTLLQGGAVVDAGVDAAADAGEGLLTGGLSAIGGLLGSGISSSGGGGSTSGGAVAPSQMSYGPFGLLTKTLPGLVAQEPNASYAGEVQGYALPSNQVQAQNPTTLGSLSLPQVNIPGYSGGVGSTGTPASASPMQTAMPIASVGGVAATPPGNAQTAGQQQQPQQGIGNPLYPPQSPMLQGGVSTTPQQQAAMQQQQAPWQSQLQGLLEGAGQAMQPVFNAVGQLIGGQPAMAANNSGLVPPPPPYTPDISALMGGNYPSVQAMNQAATAGRMRANELAGGLGREAIQGPYSDMKGVLDDVKKGRGELIKGLDKVADAMRAQIAQAEKDRFDTPRPDLNNNTLRSHRDWLEGQANARDNEINLYRSHAGLEARAAALVRQSIATQANGVADFFRGAENFIQQHGGPAAGRGLSSTINDPGVMMLHARRVITESDNAQAEKLKGDADHFDRQAKAITDELKAASAERDKVEDRIRDVRLDAYKTYMDSVQVPIKALADANNLAAQLALQQVEAYRAGVVAKQAAAQTEVAVQSSSLAAKKLGIESDQRAAELKLKAGQAVANREEQEAKLKIDGIRAAGEQAKAIHALMSGENALDEDAAIKLYNRMLQQQTGIVSPQVAGKKGAPGG